MISLEKEYILHTFCTQAKIAIAEKPIGALDSNLRPSAPKAPAIRALQLRFIAINFFERLTYF